LAVCLSVQRVSAIHKIADAATDNEAAARRAAGFEIHPVGAGAALKGILLDKGLLDKVQLCQGIEQKVR